MLLLCYRGGMNSQAVIARVRLCCEADLRDISAATGIPVARLQKIRYGITADPRSSTIDTLRAYFAGQVAVGAGAPSGKG